MRQGMYGGEGGIRTHATLARPNAFRVRPLQPSLGTSPIIDGHCLSPHFGNISLVSQMLMRGLEPPTPSLREKCTANCATPACFNHKKYHNTNDTIFQPL